MSKGSVDSISSEESFHKQKSREQDIALGDGNNAYLFRSVQVRRMINKITCLQDAQDIFIRMGMLLEKLVRHFIRSCMLC